MVDLDAPDDVRFPQWSGASGYMVLALVQALGACPFVQAQLGAHLRCRKVELEAGEALYIPPLSQRHSIILVVHCCDSKEDRRDEAILVASRAITYSRDHINGARGWLELSNMLGDYG